MRARSTRTRAVLACAVAGMLAAACGTSATQAGPASRVDTSHVVANHSSASPASPATVASPVTSPPVASTQPAPPRQTAITVIAPPDATTSVTTSVTTSEPTSVPNGPPATTTDGSATAQTTRSRHAAASVTAPSTRSTTSSTAPQTHHNSSTSTQRSSTVRHADTGALTGKVVVIDPGHNGANSAHPEIIRKQVPAGFGQYKDCNTTGTETNAGYPEFRFNWGVALALRDALRAKGITVVMTRSSDDGVGPCVNERAAIGNDAAADAVISIHGDGEAAGVRGFYVMTASRAPAGATTAAHSAALAEQVRDGLSGAGFPMSNTLGANGLWQRSDLAGLNLSQRPTVMIECGNMRNATEAALMSSADGRQRYATGIAAGVVSYLSG